MNKTIITNLINHVIIRKFLKIVPLYDLDNIGRF